MKLEEIYSNVMNSNGIGQGDKGRPTHTYIEQYSTLLEPYRDREINFLEIGVGYDFTKPYSMQMWDKYFTKAKLYAIDIKEESLAIETDRIKVFIGNQSDSGFLGDVINTVKSLDVIIDDGSHNINDLISTFNVLFPILNTGGIYIMEDIENINIERPLLEALAKDVTIIDNRHILNRWDDVLVIIKK